ncbi:MAG TPA: sulfotransferase [Rhodanobacteraceae bacterium]|nr:sulfotransferase [Rhodanobacteraceae bacterium]
MNLPNFFIVGAPKCGTTALSVYLGAHPDVFMCVPKEPAYFALDLPAIRVAKHWNQYEALFRDASETHLAIGEASTIYMHSEVAVAELHRHFPFARLLVMLRNPLDLVVSLHGQRLHDCDEDVADFARAWALCGQRRAGDRIPARCREPKVLLYDEAALLGLQLQRVLGVFPGSQVRWWFHEDFAADPARVYREALSFLGLAHDGRSEFPVVNARMRARSQRLAPLVQKPPRFAVRLAMYAKKRMGIRRLGVLNALRQASFVPSRPPAISGGLRREMQAHFAPDVHLLESITGRDLGHWLGNDGPAAVRSRPEADPTVLPLSSEP